MLKLPEAVWSRSLSIVSLLASLAAGAGAQPATQVINLRPDSGAFGASESSSFPHGFMALPGKVIVRLGGVSFEGDQYAVTDGTTAGTRLLPTFNGSDECIDIPPEIGTAGNLAFWLQCDIDNRGEIWRSDGTTAGTFPLTSGGMPSIPLPQAPAGALPEEDPNYAFASNVVYFQGCSPEPGGCTLWRTDGSVAGTREVKAGEQVTGGMIGLGNRLLFVAGDGFFPKTLAVTDGTPAGTVHLKDFELLPEHFAVAGGKVFFLAEAGGGGRELWVSDGTAAGTRAVSNFAPPDPFSSTAWLTPVGNRVYFVADDVEHGDELWTSDGTPAGTVRVTEFGFHAPFHESMRPSHVAPANGGRIVFLATDDLEQSKLWSTSGTPASTTLLATVCQLDCRDFLPRGFDRTIELVRAANGRVVFTRYDDRRQLEAWSTDGTAAGTFLLTNQVQTRPFGLGGAVFFGAHGQLWTSDGTVAGTRQWSDLPAGARVTDTQQDLGMIAGKVLFPANSNGYGNELFASTGQPGGTELLGDLAHIGGAGSNPRELTVLGDRLLFIASTAAGSGPWSSGGTAETTASIGVPSQTPGCGFDSGVPELFRAGGRVYFPGPGQGCQRDLWATDGTAAGTHTLGFTASEKVEFQGQLFFILPGGGDTSGLWKTDGTPGGKVKVFDFPAAARGAHDLAALGAELYFRAFDGDGHVQAWRSDGTLAGTRQLTAWEDDSRSLGFVRAGGFVYFLGPDFFPTLWRSDGTPGGTIQLLTSSEPADDAFTDLVSFHGALFFFLQTNDGVALYRSDGTPESTVALHTFTLDFLANETAHYPAVLGDQLLFAADDASGIELWKTDGTAAGTTLVRDIFAGPTSSRPEELTVAGGRVFFRARDAVHGIELWQSDGTAAGTRLIQDLNPETASSSPGSFAVLGDRLFFGADDGVTGHELWVLPLGGAAPCVPAADHLCLNGGRYRVDADWTANGMSGAGTAVPLSADTGYFWFFSPTNVETVLKVLDGRSLNGHVWVFYGALSNVEYNLTVTDTQTGLARRYFNPRGQFASVGDTAGFGPLGAYDRKSIAAPSAPPRITERIDSAKATGTCVPAAGRLCLNNGRFAVEAVWKDFANHTGMGTAVSLTGDTGYFWFFDPSNVEAVLKVLDATSFNGHFWVYYGALSNVEYTLTVTDTMTGKVKTYQNPLGRFASAGDTLAF